MGINFPASPTVGQKYPQPAVSGIPVYTWDGEKWTTVGGSVAAYAPPSTILPLMDATPALTGVGTAYTREDHIHPTDTTRAALTQVVRYDAAQSLTAPQQQQARQNIYAAPFDAMAYSGLQINGGMEVSQEKGNAVTSSANAYAVDGWRLWFNGVPLLSAAQTYFIGAGGFPLPYFMNISVTTAQPTLAAADVGQVYQFIEGWRCARLQWGTANAQPITIGFWTSHHRPGIYSGAIRNGANNRSYTFTYTQAAIDTPQYNTVTIPGDTAGTWAIDNTVGMLLAFTLGCGSTNIAPSANAWIAGNYGAAPGQVNGVAATTDIFRLTGVTVLPGNEAPVQTRSPFVMRSFADELIICKRYYEKSYNYGTAPGAAVGAGTNGFVTAPSNSGIVGISLSVEKRATPTIVYYDGAGAAGKSSGYTTVWVNGLALGSTGVQTKFIWVQVLGASGGVIGIDFTADARL